MTEEQNTGRLQQFADLVTGEMNAMLAEGVQPGDVYATLAAIIGACTADGSPSVEQTNAALAFVQQVMVQRAAEVYKATHVMPGETRQ